MYKKIISTLIILIITLIFTDKSYAFVLTDKTDKVDISIIPISDKINTEQNFDVLVKFKMKNGWHIFAQNPGDIGLPTTIDWKLPYEYKLENIRWSDYEAFGDAEIMQYGYGDIAYYEATIIPSKEVLNKASFTTDISWLACKDECVPEKKTFTFSLPVTKNNIFPLKTWEEAKKNADKITQEVVPNNAASNILLVIIMAFLGGIVLNFMPCIFPILSIKAISLIQTRHSRKNRMIEAFLYMAGVVASFMIIATILVFLRSQGEHIGWGFQLQSPIFVSIMIVIFFIIFLMLMDIVNIRNPFANKVGRISFSRQRINAFVTGFFAVLIASPCTAPFMGIAIGYTLSAPIYVYYPVFLSLSLGYALPFTLIGMFPRVIHRILPHPGKWMDTLKKIFAIPVLLTCVWLIWVLNNQMSIKVDGATEAIKWEVYNENEVSKLVAQGKPVFIDFTAKWCITCLANEKISLQSDKFINIIKEKKIYTFKADWTNRDPLISKALEKYGRNSIPLYIYYNGKNNESKILPQLLTPSILEEYLSN